MHSLPRHALLVVAVVALAMAASPGAAGTDQVVTIPTGDATETSIGFSQLVFDDDATDEVLLASDQVFADALASGSLQATRPLLLNDPDELETDVLAEIDRLGADTVRILGGTAAIAEQVTDDLQAEGLTVRRTFGPTRLETAEQIAQLAEEPQRIILARAFPSPGGDQTQAFADSLAAGGWAAERAWPVMLSQTDQLSATTDTYVRGAGDHLQAAEVIGGTSALSEEVIRDLNNAGYQGFRRSGATRFATAVAVGEARGFNAALMATTVILVEGQSADAWHAGFSAAAASAEFGAPIVLANGETLPQETADYLSSSVTVTDRTPVLVCACSSAACDEARAVLGI